MPRTCTICSHPERAAIEAAIVAGTSFRLIASQFGVGYKAAERHKEHIKQAIEEAQVIQREETAFHVLSEMSWCNRQAHQIYNAVLADIQPDRRVALSAISEVRKQAELYAELQGDLERGTQIDIHSDPAWLNMREIIFKALEPFPDALQAVAHALYEEGQRGRDIA